MLRHHLQGLAVFALGLGLTSGALALLHAWPATPGRVAEMAVLVVANLVATVLRFLLLRVWLHHGRPGVVAAGSAPDQTAGPDPAAARPAIGEVLEVPAG